MNSLSNLLSNNYEFRHSEAGSGPLESEDFGCPSSGSSCVTILACGMDIFDESFPEYY